MSRSRFPLPEWPPRRVALFIFCAVFALYLPSLGNGFVWDDDSYVTGNRCLWIPGGLGRIWSDPSLSPQYYPLVFSALWLEHALWGFHPLGYHLVNICLHAANAVWVWWLLRRLRVPGALLAGLLFGFHPVQVETADWISECKNLLSTFFYFASFAAYLRWLNWEESRETARGGRRHYWTALFFFILALFSKTVACSLPAAILLLIGWKRGRVRFRDVAPLLPFFGIGLGLGLYTAWLERVHVGAQGADWVFSWGEHFWIAGRDLGFYLFKLVWPDPLLFIYPHWTVSPSWLQQYGMLLAVLLCGWGLWLMQPRFGAGPLVAALFFGMTLFPALGFLNLYPLRFSFVADHFQYLACMAPLALFSAWVNSVGVRFGWGPRAWSLAFLLILTPLAVKTIFQQRDYFDRLSLSQSIILHNPHCWIALKNLGDGWRDRGKWDLALQEYNDADELHPGDVPIRLAHGTVLEKMGDSAGALKDFQQAIALDPLSMPAQIDLGAFYAQQQRWTTALPYFEKAVAIDRESIPGHFSLATACYYLGDLERALREYRLTLHLDPDFQPAQTGLATVREAMLSPSMAPPLKSK